MIGRSNAAFVAACLFWIAACTAPAHAVVGGVPENGPLGASAIMLLASNGGMCSAVVLAEDVVLTAAHCVTSAAEHRAHWRDDAGAPVLAEIAEILVHPGYDAGAIAGRRRSIDLAAVRLAAPLPGRFRPATLTASAASNGTGIDLLGWGIEREGDAGRLSAGTLRRARLSVVEPYGPSGILVWLSGGGAGACEGDSGGPIARGDAVFAVTSWARGENGAACGAVTQGVLLGPQRAFVDGALARWGRTASWR